MTAAHYGLDNLIVIVDRNGLQITGSTEEVNSLEPLAARFEAFGYAIRSADGHDIHALLDVFGAVPFAAGKPNLVMAHTVKGKGVSFMEDTVKWHHRVPNDEEYAAAMAELDAAQAALVR
jgi:transketolase